MVRQAVTGIDDILKGMDKLLGMQVPVARSMGVAMGQIVRDEAIARAPVLKPGNEGYDNQRAGQLRDAMYVAFDGRRSILSGGVHVVYGVSWNAKKAPHGHLLEFGHWMPYAVAHANGKFYTPLVGTSRKSGRKRGVGIALPGNGFHVQASPFLGPAFDSKLSSLAAVAAAAGAKTFSEVM